MSDSPFTVTLEEVAKELKLETVYSARPLSEILVRSNDVNRPGLQIVGFFDYFDKERIQILGKVEYTYLRGLPTKVRAESMDKLFATEVPAVVISRGQEIFPEALSAAQRYGVALLRTKEETSNFMAALIAYLNNMLAPRITRHGVLVEIYGEGVLMLGESGVGKSETAIELVKRGRNQAGVSQIPGWQRTGEYPAFYRAARDRDHQCQAYLRYGRSQGHRKDRHGGAAGDLG